MEIKAKLFYDTECFSSKFVVADCSYDGTFSSQLPEMGGDVKR